MDEYRDYCRHSCQECRNIMETARLIATAIGERSILENFDIYCYGEHFSLYFFSGNRRNAGTVVETFGSDIVVKVPDLEESWCERVRRMLSNSGRLPGYAQIQIIPKAE